MQSISDLEKSIAAQEAERPVANRALLFPEYLAARAQLSEQYAEKGDVQKAHEYLASTLEIFADMASNTAKTYAAVTSALTTRRPAAEAAEGRITELRELWQKNKTKVASRMRQTALQIGYCTATLTEALAVVKQAEEELPKPGSAYGKYADYNQSLSRAMNFEVTF